MDKRIRLSVDVKEIINYYNININKMPFSVSLHDILKDMFTDPETNVFNFGDIVDFEFYDDVYTSCIGRAIFRDKIQISGDILVEELERHCHGVVMFTLIQKGVIK